MNRMGCASNSFSKLHIGLWDNRHVSLKVKCRVYRAVVLSTLLYGAETWPVYRYLVRKLHSFKMVYLRSLIMKITWQNKITNVDILSRAGLPSMEDILIEKGLRWLGHVHRMKNNRLPRQLLYSQLSKGLRNRGRPNLRFKDRNAVRRNMKERIYTVIHGSYRPFTGH